MNATLTELDGNKHASHASHETRLQLLMLARRLDSFGLQTEQFLSQQLEQLEWAIEEFESEKAAWRRQLQRESTQLARQREEAGRQCDTNTSGVAAGCACNWKKRGLAETAARKSGIAPLRILLQPGQATPMQVGLLMFEISKLNRDMGGRGIRFEVDEIRIPRKRLLARKLNEESNGEILELTAYPILPLAARGLHVALELDITDRLEDWIAFKSRLLQSSLVNNDMVTIFSAGKTVTRDEKSRFGIGAATRHLDEVSSNKAEQSDFSGTALHPGSAIDCIQQQTVRLENCYEQLLNDCGLRAHIDLHTAP